MTVALPINSNSVRHFNQSVAVHPFMYGLLQRAGVPLLSPGQRLKGRVVITDFPARAHSPLDEVLALGVEPGSGEIKAKVKRVDRLLYPSPGFAPAYCGDGPAAYDRGCGYSCNC